jgi:hypothetical protein
MGCKGCASPKLKSMPSDYKSTVWDPIHSQRVIPAPPRLICPASRHLTAPHPLHPDTPAAFAGMKHGIPFNPA